MNSITGGLFMLRIAICDDCPDFLEQVVSMLNHWPNRPSDLKFECFSDGDALLNAHSESPFDIILIDVVMPLLNGIETARELRIQDKSVKVVFLTSSPEYAVDSYTVKASNYLLKPLDVKALYRCLDELYAELRQNARSITVRSINITHRVELSSIEFIESQNKHIVFVLSNGTTIESIQPLYFFEDKLTLSDGFFKCHRSYIVNLHQIDTYSAKEIQLRSGICIPISRSHHKEFETAYFSAIFSKEGDAE